MRLDNWEETSPDKLRQAFSNYISRGSIPEGIVFFQQVVARYPDYGLAWDLLGRLLDTSGKFEAAYHAFYQGALTSERSEKVSTEAKVNDFVKVAKFCLRHGWVQRAQRHLEEVLLLSPRHEEARSLLGQLNVEKIKQLPTATQVPSKLSPSEKDSEPAQPVLTDISRLMAEGHKAFTLQDFERAEVFYRKAIKLGPRHSSAYISLAQTFYRRGQLAEALQIMEQGLSRETDNRIAILQTLGSLYMKQGIFHKVIDIYTQIVQKARSESERVGAYQWIGKGYAELGEFDKAKEAYQKALELAPTNSHIRGLLERLQRRIASARGELLPSAESTTETLSPDDEEEADWGEDEDIFPGPGGPTISPMLEVDAERYSWRDPAILARGGVVQIEDAQRLMRDAISAKETFGTKALRFLEAAKAFGTLDESQRDPNQHQEALNRYAGQQAGYYMLQLVGEIKRNSKTRTDRARWLRDAACAYYVESMKILQYRKLSFMLYFLQKYLQALLLLELGEADAKSIFGSLEGTQKLEVILQQAARHSEPRILETVAKGVLELGRAERDLIRKIYNNRVVRRTIFRHKEEWRHVLAKLGEPRTDLSFPTAMRSIINKWKKSELDALLKFSEIYNYRVTLDNIGDVRGGLEELLTLQGVYSETDKQLLRETIDNVLSHLVRYGELPPNSVERDLLAERARQQIRKLRDRIKEYPTYWGRVNFDALLQKWEKLLGRAEEARLAEIRPELIARLESKRLPTHESIAALVFSVMNGGQATALETKFHLLPDETLYECNDPIVELGNIPPGKSAPAQIRLKFRPTNESLKFLTIRYTVSYSNAAKTPLPSFEDTVHFGDFRTIAPNPFNEAPLVTDERMFKGRDELLGWLTAKLNSEERYRSTLLYGLTRTGKSSILYHLQKRTLGRLVQFEGQEQPFRLLPLRIPFDKCAAGNTADEFYSAAFKLVQDQLDLLRVDSPEQSQYLPDVNFEELSKSIGGFEEIIHDLYKAGFYSVFLIDEFSLYRQLFEKKILDAGFLSRLRSFSLDERVASFVYAGTYDLKALTSDPAYGFTGQFVATDERQVGRISDDAARELVQVIQDRLYFSDTAIEEILFLSGRIPYFIQMICKNCVYYANEHETPSITPVELQAVIDLLVSREFQSDQRTDIRPISAAQFSANVWNRSDPLLTTAVLAVLSFDAQAGRKDSFISAEQIERTFRASRITLVPRELVDTIEDLTSKQILEVRRNPDDVVAYRIGVDLFRRWFVLNHSLEWALGRLKMGVEEVVDGDRLTDSQVGRSHQEA